MSESPESGALLLSSAARHVNFHSSRLIYVVLVAHSIALSLHNVQSTLVNPTPVNPTPLNSDILMRGNGCFALIYLVNPEPRCPTSDKAFMGTEIANQCISPSLIRHYNVHIYSAYINQISNYSTVLAIHCTKLHNLLRNFSLEPNI